MWPEREHSVEYRLQRLYMADIILDRPGTPANEFCFLVQSDGLVLMPGHEPILLGCLVEE